MGASIKAFDCIESLIPLPIACRIRSPAAGADYQLMHGKSVLGRDRDRHTLFMGTVPDRLMVRSRNRNGEHSHPKRAGIGSMSRQVITATIWRPRTRPCSVSNFHIVWCICVIGGGSNVSSSCFRSSIGGRLSPQQPTQNGWAKIGIACLHSTDRQLDPQKT